MQQGSDSQGFAVFTANMKHIGTNYFPALGFVNRTGIRVYDGGFSRRDRNIAGMRFIEVLIGERE